MQRRGLRRSGQTLLRSGDQHDPNLLHRCGHQVRVQRLRLVREKCRRYLLHHHGHLKHQRNHSLPRQRTRVQQHIDLERRLFYLRHTG